MTADGMTTDPASRLFRPESVRQSLGLYLPTTFAARFLGLLRGIALAWLIAESEFALFQVALLVVNILNPLCSFGLNEAVARYVPQYETKGVLRPFLARAVSLVTLVSLILSLAAYLGAEPLGRFLFATLEQGGKAHVTPAIYVPLTRLAAATTFSLIAYFLLLSVFKGLRMFRAVSLMELVNNLAFTVLAIAAAWSGWRTAGAMLACYAITLVAVVLLVVLPLRGVVGRAPGRQERPRPGDSASNHVLLQMFRFSIWAALAAVMWQTLQYYPMWYLQKVHGPQVTAVLAGVRHITQMVLITAVAVVTVVQTAVTKTWESRGPAAADQQLGLAFKSTALFLLVVCTVLAALAHLLMRMFPRSYAEGEGIVSSCSLFFLLGGYLSFVAIHFNLIERTRHLFVPWTAGVAAGVAAGRYLVRPDLPALPALNAAVWAGILGMSAALAVCVCLLWIERRPLDFGSALLLAAAYLLAWPIYVLIPVVLLLLLLAWRTQLIFSREGQREFRRFAADGYNRFRRMLGPTKS